MFELLNNFTFQIVALGSTLLGALCGLVGVFTVLKKESLIGDAISHASLPGICVAYILTREKNLVILLLGALVAGIIANIFIQFLAKSKSAKFDNLLALTLSTFFGLGIVLITYIQKLSGANKAGLNKFIFGQAAAILKEDVYIIISVCVIVVLIILIFFKQFTLLVFDDTYARVIYGKKIKFYNLLLYISVVMCIIIGLETVGVIMMSSLLIVPAVAARQWTNNIYIMSILSVVIGSCSAFFGTLFSSSSLNVPTGPMIVMFLSFFVLVSILFSTKRGLIRKYIYRRKQKKQILEDMKNINVGEARVDV